MKQIGKTIAQSLVDHLKAARTSPTSRCRAAGDQRFADRRGGGAYQEGHPPGHRRPAATRSLAEYDTPEWAALEGPAMGQRSGLALQQENRRRGRPPMTAPPVRRDCRLQGGRRRSGASPVTGNDATIAGLQLIISGDQYNTISKPSEIVAAAAANVAVRVARGREAQGRHDPVQHADATVHADAHHRRQPQVRDHRQAD